VVDDKGDVTGTSELVDDKDDNVVYYIDNLWVILLFMMTVTRKH